MPRLPKRTIRGEVEIIISEQNGVRSLHIDGDMIQSAMRINAPNELELIYTQCMMAFLLFHPLPAHVLMIGLGGGSLAKFVYHHMPQTKITVIEINPQIIASAHNYFYLPPEDDRLEIIQKDGAQYIAEQSMTEVDILMLDGFDGDCQMNALGEQEFYTQAFQALAKHGILVVNLLSRDKDLEIYLQRIKGGFNNHVITMLSEVRGNLLVFAFKNSPGKLSWKALKSKAKKLEEKYGLPFADFVTKFRKNAEPRSQYLDI